MTLEGRHLTCIQVFQCIEVFPFYIIFSWAPFHFVLNVLEFLVANESYFLTHVYYLLIVFLVVVFLLHTLIAFSHSTPILSFPMYTCVRVSFWGCFAITIIFL